MRRKLKAGGLIILSLFLLAACQPETELVSDAIEQGRYVFGYSCIASDNPFFIALEASIRETVEAQGHVLITKYAKSDADLQNVQIDELIAEGVDAVFLTPVDSEKITPALDKLNAAGIRVINVDTQVQELEKVDAFVGSDNKEAGRLCSKDLLERFPKGARILILDCPSRNSINERIEGFEEVLFEVEEPEKYIIIDKIDAKGDLYTALLETERVLGDCVEIDVIMCGNDPTALGALVAVNGAKRQDILIYSIDGSPELKKELAKQQCLIAATVGQSTEKMGTEAANAGLKILNNEPYEKMIYTETFLINHENVKIYGIEKWQ